MFGFGQKRKSRAEKTTESVRDLSAPEDFRRDAGLAARHISEVLTTLGSACQPGNTTLALRDLALEEMQSCGLKPTMKNTRGFPHEIGFAVNHVVLHGGSNDRPLRDGDLVTIQLNARWGNGLAHLAWTFSTGKPSLLGERLRRSGREALEKVGVIICPGLHLGDIGHAIQSHIEQSGFSVVREYCGYGMGPNGIQDPQILCYGRPGIGLKLQENMIVNIHVIANAGRSAVRQLSDNWTVVTKDHSQSILFAVMFHIGADRAEMLSSMLP